MAPYGDASQGTKRPNTDNNATSAKKPRTETLSSSTNTESQDKHRGVPFSVPTTAPGPGTKSKLQSDTISQLKKKGLDELGMRKADKVYAEELYGNCLKTCVSQGAIIFAKKINEIIDDGISVAGEFEKEAPMLGIYFLDVLDAQIKKSRESLRARVSKSALVPKTTINRYSDEADFAMSLFSKADQDTLNLLRKQNFNLVREMKK